MGAVLIHWFFVFVFVFVLFCVVFFLFFFFSDLVWYFQHLVIEVEYCIHVW